MTQDLDNPPDRPAPEIVVTLNMLNAGAAAFATYDHRFERIETAALNAFIAMAEAAGFKATWTAEVEAET